MAESPQDLLMGRRNLIKFDTVHEEVQNLADLNYDDVTIDMEKIRVLPDKTNEKNPNIFLEVPDIGILRMTPWSEGQLGSALGIRWNKWFDPDHIPPEEIQEELVRRFSRTQDKRKIRARRFPKNVPGRDQCDGIIRAILSPTYSSIDDIRMFDRMKARFRGQMDDMGFMHHLGTSFYNDKASHFSMVADPIDMGPIDRNHPDKSVRDIYDIAEKEGQLPERDWVYNGLHFRNSEVGYTAVTIDSTCFRLVCLNGCIISINDGRLLYRMHRGISDEAIDELLDSTFRKMPSSWEANRKRMLALKDTTLEDPEAEILKFMDRKKQTKKFADQVKEAYEAEPLPTRYGIIQAITRAAQSELDMDKRFELEELAGQYMQAA